MGWDAYAVFGNGQSIERRYTRAEVKVVDGETRYIEGELQIIDKGIRAIFTQANEKVLLYADSVDGYLAYGGLECPACARSIQEITGESCYSEDWSPEKVKQIANLPSWDVVEVEDRDWAYWSSLIFLETCAENNFGIRLSW